MFNTNILAQKEFNTSNILEYNNIDESFFMDTLQFIKESMNDYRNINKTLYKSILESAGNEEIINESFSDFFESVKKIIDKFLKFIKSLFDKFIIAFNKFISSDKFIEKNKDKFASFSDKDKFSIDGYNYTFSPAIPLINAQAKFEESFVKLDFQDLQGETDQKKIMEKVKEKYTELINDVNGDWYDSFRGEVISQKAIAQEDFAQDLWNVYRNGSSSKETIEIISTYVGSALLRFQNYKKDEKSIKDTKESIEKDYESIKKQVQGIVKQNATRDINKLVGLAINSDYDKVGTGNITVSTEVMNQIDLFVKKKAEQIIEMCNIHSLAFSYKLDAIKDCYKQDKDVLYKALSKLASVNTTK